MRLFPIVSIWFWSCFLLYRFVLSRKTKTIAIVIQSGANIFFRYILCSRPKLQTPHSKLHTNLNVSFVVSHNQRKNDIHAHKQQRKISARVEQNQKAQRSKRKKDSKACSTDRPLCKAFAEFFAAQKKQRLPAGKRNHRQTIKQADRQIRDWSREKNFITL